MSSLNYFEEKAVNWDEMGASFFGEAPRQKVHNEIQWDRIKSIADVGTGTGYLLSNVPEGIKRYAIDQSSEMLAIVNKRFEQDDLTTVEADGHHISLPDNSVDAVVANMYLHHTENPALAIAEMARILKPGGQFVFTDLDKHQHKFLVEEQHDRWMGFDRNDIKKWMSEAGLSQVETDCVGSDCCAPSCCGGEKASISIFLAKAVK